MRPSTKSSSGNGAAACFFGRVTSAACAESSSSARRNGREVAAPRRRPTDRMLRAQRRPKLGHRRGRARRIRRIEQRHARLRAVIGRVRVRRLADVRGGPLVTSGRVQDGDERGDPRGDRARHERRSPPPTRLDRKRALVFCGFCAERSFGGDALVLVIRAFLRDRPRRHRRGHVDRIERAHDLLRRRVAPCRALLEAAHDDLVDGARQCRDDLRRQLRPIAQHAGDERGTVAFERALARQHLVEHDAEREDVAPRIDVLAALDLLRRPSAKSE